MYNLSETTAASFGHPIKLVTYSSSRQCKGCSQEKLLAWVVTTIGAPKQIGTVLPTKEEREVPGNLCGKF